MLLAYLSLIFLSINVQKTSSENEFALPQVNTHFLIGIVFDPQYLLEAHNSTQATLRQVMSFVQQEYQWGGTLTFRYMPYTEFQLKTGTTALVSVLSCRDTWALYQEVEDDGLIFIAISGEDCPRLPTLDAITVALTTPGSELSQFLLDLRTSHVIEWKSVAIICDHTIDGKMIESLVDSLTTEVFDSELNTKSSLAMVYTLKASQTDWERRNDIFELLSNLPKLDENTNFLVALRFDLIGMFLDVIKQLSLMRPTCQWLFILPHKLPRNNLHDFAFHLQEGANVAFIYNNSIYHSRCVTGLECHLEGVLQSLIEGLDVAAQVEMDRSKKVSEEEWEQIKPSRAEHKQTLLQFMKCDNCTMWKSLTAELWGQEYTNAVASEHLLDVGFWNPREGCVFMDHLFPHIKYGFRQLLIPIASFHFPPWQIIKYNSSGHAVEFKGIVFEVVNFLAKKFNFTYSVTIPVNDSNVGLGLMSRNNSGHTEDNNMKQNTELLSLLFNSISTLVKEKKIFLGACALTITEGAGNAINFTEPISIETYVFLVSRPKELSRALLFILPFTSDAWLCIVSSIVLMAPMLYSIHRLSPFYEYHGTRNSNGLGKISNCFWYVYGALLQQGGIYLPTADSGRLIIGTWWVVVLVVVTTYCGNLVAFLTFPKMDKLITNIHDLLERKDILTWGMPDTAYIKALLMTADDPLLKEVYDRAELHEELTADVVESVKLGKHAYIQTKTRLLYLMQQQYQATNSCHFSLSNEEFLQEKLGMIMAKDNPYLELFNKEIGKLHRMGLIHKWMTDYLPPRDRCWGTMHSTEVNNHTVNLDDMQGSFFVLFLGIMLSFVIILMEFVIKKYRLSRERGVIRPFIQ